MITRYFNHVFYVIFSPGNKLILQINEKYRNECVVLKMTVLSYFIQKHIFHKQKGVYR